VNVGLWDRALAVRTSNGTNALRRVEHVVENHIVDNVRTKESSVSRPKSIDYFAWHYAQKPQSVRADTAKRRRDVSLLCRTSFGRCSRSRRMSPRNPLVLVGFAGGRNGRKWLAPTVSLPAQALAPIVASQEELSHGRGIERVPVTL
jgi:hypothetical protein